MADAQAFGHSLAAPLSVGHLQEQREATCEVWTLQMQAETWNGMPMNAEAAAEVFGADDVFPMSEVRTSSSCGYPQFASGSAERQACTAFQ